MTTENALRRRGRAISLILIAVAMAGIAFITLAIEARSTHPDTARGPVFAGLADNISSAQRISVIAPEVSYRIERGSRGWVMKDRGDYPVEAGPLGRLTRSLEGLQYVRRMTSDPARFERLGVGDPRHGGHGVLVRVERGDGALLVDLIVGMQPNGLFVRKPEENQVWAVRTAQDADLPPLRSVASWLDLAPHVIRPEDIARVEITPPSGRSYILARANQQATDFTIVSPAGQSALVPSSITDTAERIAHLAPVDVKTAPEITGAPHAHIRVGLFNGVTVDGELIDSDNHTWIKLVARPPAAPPQQAASPATTNSAQDQAAYVINQHTAQWAFALSPEDVAALVPPLSDLLPGRSHEPAALAPH